MEEKTSLKIDPSVASSASSCDLGCAEPYGASSPAAHGPMNHVLVPRKCWCCDGHKTSGWMHEKDFVCDECYDTPWKEDPDDDEDGVLDADDAFPLDPTEWEDSDRDGVGNNKDQFPDDPYEWIDTDLDGIGNNADTDDDNDGVSDPFDLFPLDASESRDSDGDGVGDNEGGFEARGRE